MLLPKGIHISQVFSTKLKIPWTEEPGGLRGVARVRHDLATEPPAPN